MYHSRISGTGSYLPATTLDNFELEKLIDTSNDWIMERTGIETRHISATDQATSDLAYEAAIAAIESAKISPQDIDAIIVATITPDQPLPSTACFLQSRLGCRQIMAFDVAAACSGFLYATSIADDMIRGGNYKHILVIGAEILSRITNYKDRGSCILFGDGAGAIILSRSLESEDSKIMSSCSASCGDSLAMLQIPKGGSRTPITMEALANNENCIAMQGREVFKSAIQFLKGSCVEALDKAKIDIADVDWFFFHQANLRIIETLAKHLKVPMERVPCNIQETGNTSSASIPILLDQKVRDGTLVRGQTIMFAAFGGGLTSSAAVLKY